MAPDSVEARLHVTGLKDKKVHGIIISQFGLFSCNGNYDFLFIDNSDLILNKLTILTFFLES